MNVYNKRYYFSAVKLFIQKKQLYKPHCDNNYQISIQVSHLLNRITKILRTI